MSLSHHLCSHSPLLRHLLVSLYESVPHAASFYLLAATRPIAPLTPTLSRDLRSVQWLLQALSFYRRKTLREHVCPDGEHWSARAGFENVFIGYVNLPITRFPDF